MTEPYYQKDGIEIYHGDCRDILPQLGLFDFLLTDPPYGIDLQDNSKGGRYGRSRPAFENSIVGDETQELGNFVLDWAEQNKIATAVFSSPKMPWPGKWSSYLVWDKGPAVGGGGDVSRCWKQSWEMIQVVRNKPLRLGRDSSVLKCWVTPDLSKFHPAAKPVALLKYLIGQLCDKSDHIIDPFFGSGTTLVAAKELGMRATGIEVEEKYCQHAANQLANSSLDFSFGEV